MPEDLQEREPNWRWIDVYPRFRADVAAAQAEDDGQPRRSDSSSNETREKLSSTSSSSDYPEKHGVLSNPIEGVEHLFIAGPRTSGASQSQSSKSRKSKSGSDSTSDDSSDSPPSMRAAPRTVRTSPVLPRANAAPSQDEIAAHESWVNGSSSAGGADAESNGSGKSKRKRESSGSLGSGSPKKQKAQGISSRGNPGYEGQPRMRTTSNPAKVMSAGFGY